MSTAITFPKDNDLSGLRLEQTANGNACTPWFQFDGLRHDIGIADFRSQYHTVIQASVSAFSSLLGIDRLDVMVTQREDPSDPHVGYWWRLSTRHPHTLPKPKPTTKPVLPENRGAIDI